ncbi:hypothetical protein FRB99_006760 [Tulasnella sp. 403]|nr:hypothetical protein FRB99_006760 [Tulasnella sp. 403]
MTVSPLIAYIPKVETHLANLQKDATQDAEWQEVELCARNIADALRARDAPAEKDQSLLGQSTLPKSATTLLTIAKNESGTPRSPASAIAIFEILRAAANLCRDNDRNRQIFLDAGFPAVVASILRAYWRVVDAPRAPDAPSPLSIRDLSIIKNGIGSLLNASLRFGKSAVGTPQPVRQNLLLVGAPLTILRLCCGLYAPGAWASCPNDSIDEWAWRRGLSSWSWMALDALKVGDSDDDEDATKGQVFNEDAVVPLSKALAGLVPPFPPEPLLAPNEPSERQSLIASDVEALEQISMIIESLALDSEAARVEWATTRNPESTPTERSLLESLVDFIEKAYPPPYWSSTASPEKRKVWEDKLALSKAAVIKAVIAIAAEDKNLDVLWDAKSEDYPGGWFVQRMVGWIKGVQLGSTDAPDQGRDDLVICATLSLGNLARKAPNALRLVNSPSMDPEADSGLDLILDLVRRSDGVALQSEGTRVLVNVVKGLFAQQNAGLNGTKLSSAPPSAGGSYPIDEAERQQAINKISTLDSTEPLAEMIGRSGRYPILLNEAIVALILLSSKSVGLPSVMQALLTPLPYRITEAGVAVQASAGNTGAKEATTASRSSASCPMDMLAVILRNPTGTFPPELGANACALLASLSKGTPDEVEKMKTSTRGALENLVADPIDADETPTKTSEMLRTAAKRTLEVWGSGRAPGG